MSWIEIKGAVASIFDRDCNIGKESVRSRYKQSAVGYWPNSGSRAARPFTVDTPQYVIYSITKEIFC